jgi:hypothetical protein
MRPEPFVLLKKSCAAFPGLFFYRAERIRLDYDQKTRLVAFNVPGGYLCDSSSRPGRPPK